MPGCCCINNCDNPARSRGMCAKHYTRYYKHQDTAVNFKAFDWWRKGEKVAGLIEPEVSRRSYEEQEVLRTLFTEQLSEDGHSRSYEPCGISQDIGLLEGIDGFYAQDFDNKVNMKPSPYREGKSRPLTEREFYEIFGFGWLFNN